MPNTVLTAGALMLADTIVPCPKCGGQITIKIKFSIENLHSMSMILWQHQDLITCPACQVSVVPVITAFDTLAIKWQPSMVATAAKPLIEVPGQIDISKILKM